MLPSGPGVQSSSRMASGPSDVNCGPVHQYAAAGIGVLGTGLPGRSRITQDARSIRHVVQQVAGCRLILWRESGNGLRAFPPWRLSSRIACVRQGGCASSLVRVPCWPAHHGFVNFVAAKQQAAGFMRYSCHDNRHCCSILQRVSLSTGYHRARGVAPLPLQPQFPRCRRPARHTRRDLDLRDGTPMVSEVRPSLREPTPPLPCASWRQMAPR